MKAPRFTEIVQWMLGKTSRFRKLLILINTEKCINDCMKRRKKHKEKVFTNDMFLLESMRYHITHKLLTHY
jgi:hypothetical protein